MGNRSEIYALIDSGNENDVQLGLIVWSGIDKAAHDTFVSEWQAWADLFGMSLCKVLTMLDKIYNLMNRSYSPFYPTPCWLPTWKIFCEFLKTIDNE